MLDSNTFKLIRNLCRKFKIPPEIEFTCYDSYKVYFQHYYGELNKDYKQILIERTCIDANKLRNSVLDKIEKTALLHILTLISICTKYILGPNAKALFYQVGKYLHLNGIYFGRFEILNAEYNVFRYLQFKVS